MFVYCVIIVIFPNILQKKKLYERVRESSINSSHRTNKLILSKDKRLLFKQGVVCSIEKAGCLESRAIFSLILYGYYFLFLETKNVFFPIG